MALIRPFRGLRPIGEYASEVLAPPYDVLSSVEAKALAAGKPWSFLHISKPEIDLPDATDPYSDSVYRKAAKNFGLMLTAGILKRDPAPYYYVYRMREDDHVQTGLVAVASVQAYRNNRIRRHENTLPKKERDRINQIEALNAQTGPVLMAYRDDDTLERLLNSESEKRPEMRVTTDAAVEHSLWVVSDKKKIATLTAAFDEMPALYIADGHHRSAAAATIANKRGGTGDSAACFFLSVLFPQSALRILDYNRIVKDLGGRSADNLRASIASNYRIKAITDAVRPSAKGMFTMYLDHQWYQLDLRRALKRMEAPAAELDPKILTETILQPLLGIKDLRTDPRIEFVGGRRGLGELERRVDSGEMAVAFSLLPTSMSQLVAVADAGAIMPPKSTWFEPKLADGAVSHVLD